LAARLLRELRLLPFRMGDRLRAARDLWDGQRRLPGELAAPGAAAFGLRGCRGTGKPVGGPILAGRPEGVVPLWVWRGAGGPPHCGGPSWLRDRVWVLRWRWCGGSVVLPAFAFALARAAAQSLLLLRVCLGGCGRGLPGARRSDGGVLHVA